LNEGAQAHGNREVGQRSAPVSIGDSTVARATGARALVKLRSSIIPVVRDEHASPESNLLSIAGAEDKLRNAVAERLAAAVAAARMKEICRQLDQQLFFFSRKHCDSKANSFHSSIY
jgi:hypothetical protein